MKKLKEVVDKQRDEIRAKDRELTLKNEDVEAVRTHSVKRLFSSCVTLKNLHICTQKMSFWQTNLQPDL